MAELGAMEASPEQGPVRRIFAFLRLALSTHQQDFTRGSLGRAVTLLAIPMVLEPLMEALFAIVDVFFVGRVGSDAVAAVGLTEGLVTLVYTLGFGLAIPTTALVSRAIGEGKPEHAAEVAVQANGVALASSIPLALLGLFFAGPALSVMGASDAVRSLGTPYATITLASTPVIVLLFVNAAIFRGSGDAAVPLRALWLANGLNIVLDPCFIFGWGPFPELGVSGAAVASLTGRSVGVAYLWWQLLRPNTRVTVTRQSLRVAQQTILRLLALAWGSLGQLLVERAAGCC